MFHNFRGRRGGISERYADFHRDGAAQAAKRLGLVFVLGPTVLGDDQETARLVPEPNSGAGLITLLPAGAAGAIGIDAALAQERVIVKSKPFISMTGW